MGTLPQLLGRHEVDPLGVLRVLGLQSLVPLLSLGVGQVGHPATQEAIFLRQSRVHLVHCSVNLVVGRPTLHVLGDGLELRQGQVGDLTCGGSGQGWSGHLLHFGLGSRGLLGHSLGTGLPECLGGRRGLGGEPLVPGASYGEAPGIREVTGVWEVVEVCTIAN